MVTRGGNPGWWIILSDLSPFFAHRLWRISHFFRFFSHSRRLRERLTLRHLENDSSQYETMVVGALNFLRHAHILYYVQVSKNSTCRDEGEDWEGTETIWNKKLLPVVFQLIFWDPTVRYIPLKFRNGHWFVIGSSLHRHLTLRSGSKRFERPHP